MNTALTPTDLQRALRLSLAEGSAWALMVGLAETYFIAVGVFLGATPLQLGLVVALPLALGGVGPLGALGLLRVGVRRRSLAAAGVAVQVVVLVGLAWRLGTGRLQVVELIAAICCYQAVGQAAGTAWSSWYGDLVPAATRGTWFSQRNRLVYLTTCVGLTGGGLVMHHLAPGGTAGPESARAFALLMTCAALARVVSGVLLWAAPEPAFIGLLTRQRALQAAGTRRGGRALRILGLVAVFHFTVYWASPFFSPFLFKDLHFTYLQYMGVTLCVIVIKALVGTSWGHLVDRRGPRPVFLASMMLIALVPLPWVWANGLPLVVLGQALSGAAWSGFEVGYLTLLLENSRSRERPYLFALQSLGNGWMQLAGVMFASLVIMPRVGGYRDVFAISAAGRLAVVLVAPLVLVGLATGRRALGEAMSLRVFGLRAHGGFAVRPVMTSDAQEESGAESGTDTAP